MRQKSSKTPGVFLGAVALGLALSLLSLPALARKGSEPVYEDPFDLGAGGASLTRASKEGRVFANPALMVYGGKFHRWLGFTSSFLSNRESIATARTIMSNSQKKQAGVSAEGDASAPDDDTGEFVDKVFENPVRVGWGMALSWITGYYGLSVFSRFEPDIRAREFGENGLPEVRFSAESYHGVALGLPIQTPFRWLSFGVTGKYLYAAEPDIHADLSDQAKIESFASPDFIQDLASHNTGLGIDAGALLFFQGRYVDYSFAGKVDDIGGTHFTGSSDSPEDFKQVVSAGMGLTLHTGSDALHLAIDVRDLTRSYEQEMFKRIHMGAKLTLQTYIGLCAGYYHGYPSFGAELDLLLMRVALTSYTRELGEYAQSEPRHIYMASISVGK